MQDYYNNQAYVRFAGFVFMVAVLVLCGFLLAGCQTTSSQGDISNVCEALSANAGAAGPIRYNTASNKHGRIAGKVLALDLATRNRLGIGLHCPGF
jgi:predicted small secreted protein